MQKLSACWRRWCWSVSELERLFAWDVGVDDLPAMRDRIRQREEYPIAVRRLATNLLRDADNDPALGGLLRDAGRTVAALSAAGLNASGPITLGRLKDVLRGFGLVSPGRARSLLSYMIHLGYLERDRPGGDPGQVRYRATPRFLASYARHETTLLDAVCLLEPAAASLAAHIGEASVMGAFALEQGRAFVAGSAQTSGFEGWYRVFMHRLGGIQVLHGLVAEAEAFPPRGPIRFSVPDAARRFQVSRVHVARMVRDAEVEGFASYGAGALTFTETGRAALDWLYASRLCIHLACAARTLRAYPMLHASVA